MGGLAPLGATPKGAWGRFRCNLWGGRGPQPPSCGNIYNRKGALGITVVKFDDLVNKILPY